MPRKSARRIDTDTATATALIDAAERKCVVTQRFLEQLLSTPGGPWRLVLRDWSFRARGDYVESHRALTLLILEQDLVRTVCNFSGSCSRIKAEPARQHPQGHL